MSRTRTILFFLLLWSAGYFSACRISPEPSQSEPQVVSEPTAPLPSISSNEAKAPDKAELIKPPPKEVFARVFPESLIAAPEKNSASRAVDYNTLVATRSSAPQPNSGWRYRKTRRGEIVGFEFSNQGGNLILPPRRDSSKDQFYTRDFQFRFDERARQDIHLMVSDWVPSRDRVFRLSEIMNSVMLFFPRKVLPAIVNAGTRNIVNLPTGEIIEFDASTHEIRGGVLSEASVDVNPDGRTRRFPAVEYHGAGLMVRVNSRGKDPRIANVATITTGTPPADCNESIRCNQCQVPSKDLWDQNGAARFKFSTDADFEKFLITRCRFGIPNTSSEIAVSTVHP